MISTFSAKESRQRSIVQPVLKTANLGCDYRRKPKKERSIIKKKPKVTNPKFNQIDLYI